MADSTVLLPTTTFNGSLAQPIIGSVGKGSGYLGSQNPSHTVQYTVSGTSAEPNSGFVGSIKMQATLVADPEDTDWFDVDDTVLSVSSPASETNTVIKVFPGNFVWVRPVVNFTAGSVNRILYAHS